MFTSSSRSAWFSMGSTLPHIIQSDASSGMLRRVALARTGVSEELCTSFIRVTRIGALGTTLAATSNRRTFVILRGMGRLVVTANVPSSSILVTLIMEALSSSETSVLIRVTRRSIPEDVILHIHRGKKLNLTIDWLADR
jgi:hypothetical protein